MNYLKFRNNFPLRNHKWWWYISKKKIIIKERENINIFLLFFPSRFKHINSSSDIPFPFLWWSIFFSISCKKIFSHFMLSRTEKNTKPKFEAYFRFIFLFFEVFTLKTPLRNFLPRNIKRNIIFTHAFFFHIALMLTP